MTYFKKDVYSFRKSKKPLVSTIIATGLFAFGLTPSASASDVEGTSESTIVMEVSPEEDVARTYVSDKADFTITRTIGTRFLENAENDDESIFISQGKDEDGSDIITTRRYIFEFDGSSYPEYSEEVLHPRNWIADGYDYGLRSESFNGVPVTSYRTGVDTENVIDTNQPIQYINYYKPYGDSYSVQVVLYKRRVSVTEDKPLYPIVSTTKYRLSSNTYINDEGKLIKGNLPLVDGKEIFAHSVSEQGNTLDSGVEGYHKQYEGLRYLNDHHTKTSTVIAFYRKTLLPSPELKDPSKPDDQDKVVFISSKGEIAYKIERSVVSSNKSFGELIKFTEDGYALARLKEEDGWTAAYERLATYKKELAEQNGEVIPPTEPSSSSADSGSNSATLAPDMSTTESTGKDDFSSSSPSSSTDSGSNSATPTPDTSTTESTGEDDSSSSSPSSSADSGSNSATLAPDMSTTESTDKKDPSKPSVHSKGNKEEKTITGVLLTDTDAVSNKDKATRLDVKKEDKTKAFAPEANSVHTNVARDSKLLPKTGERISLLSSLGILISTVSLGIVKKYRKDY